MHTHSLLLALNALQKRDHAEGKRTIAPRDPRIGRNGEYIFHSIKLFNQLYEKLLCMDVPLHPHSREIWIHFPFDSASTARDKR